jgi:hypothetical protein
MTQINPEASNQQANPNKIVVKLNQKIQLPKVAVSDQIISSTVAPSDNIDEIANDPILSNSEKIEKLQEIIQSKQLRLKTLTQKAAQSKCLDAIELARQYVSLLNGHLSDDEVEDDDMDIFDVITYNAKLVALKKSNALIVTGDAGVGKTHSVKEAIQFLNPIRETLIVDADEEIAEDTNEDSEIITNEVETEVEPTVESQETKPTESNIVETTNELGKPVFKIKVNLPKEKVVKTLRDSNNHAESGYYIAKGTSSAAGLYELLFIHRHKLLIFDDFDSVLKDEDCVNYLKAALDTYAIREVSKMRAGNSFNSLGMTDTEMWDEYEATGKVPNQFRFYGNIIFISNIHEDKFDKALISRALHVEVRLTKAQMIERMKSLMMDIRPECPLEWKLEALHYLEYLTSNFICKFDLNLRELIHFIDIRKGFPDDTITINGKSLPLWKQLAKKRIVKSKLKRIA